MIDHDYAVYAANELVGDEETDNSVKWEYANQTCVSGHGRYNYQGYGPTECYLTSVQRQISQMSLDLMEECNGCTEDSMLSKGLCEQLESFSRLVRREVVRKVRKGCAPLFVACKRGCVPIVEYLVTVCSADIEQRGLYEVPEERTFHCVTPLWCAVVSGQLPVVRYLTHVGANINATSDSGSTPVRSACFMTHIEIVKYLVEHGADIRKPNINGGTCLINSVQSTKLCLYLITKGADVNAKDIQDKTALHYAVQEHRLETTKLLLLHGANPFAKSRYGDDALRTACLKGAHVIFDYLKTSLVYPPENLAEAHELIGSTFLEEHNETRVAVLHWRLAHHIRTAQNPTLEKLPKVPLRPAYKNAQEFTTLEELDQIAGDVDAMRMQSLLICERILGIRHKDLLYRLIFRGASYADSKQMQRCIDMWRLLLEVRVETSSVLHFDTSYAAQALVRYMLDVYWRDYIFREDNDVEILHVGDDFDEDEHANDEAIDGQNYRFANVVRILDVPALPVPAVPKFEDVMGIFTLLADHMLQAELLLQVRPVWRKQQENFDSIFKCVTHLIYLSDVLATTFDEKKQVFVAVQKLVKADVRTSANKDTLLHMCLSPQNVIKSSYMRHVRKLPTTFPNSSVIKLLIDCGIDVNAQNNVNSTGLHIASHPANFDNEIVLMLLEKGADIDMRNKDNDQPVKLLAKEKLNTIPLMNYVNLKCLAASAIGKYKIPHSNLPKCLQDFVQKHEA